MHANAVQSLIDVMMRFLSTLDWPESIPVLPSSIVRWGSSSAAIVIKMITFDVAALCCQGSLRAPSRAQLAARVGTQGSCPQVARCDQKNDMTSDRVSVIIASGHNAGMVPAVIQNCEIDP